MRSLGTLESGFTSRPPTKICLLMREKKMLRRSDLHLSSLGLLIRVGGVGRGGNATASFTGLHNAVPPCDSDSATES